MLVKAFVKNRNKEKITKITCVFKQRDMKNCYNYIYKDIAIIYTRKRCYIAAMYI